MESRQWVGYLYEDMTQTLAATPAITYQPLTITGLTKRFGTRPVVHDLDLALEHGDFVALLGPSGCGKTTTLRLIAGFEQPDAGTIAIGGQVVVGRGVFVQPERRRVGMVFQDHALFPHLTVGQNVAFGLARGRQRAPRVAECLELVGLGGYGERLPHQLSGGQQQRVALARALAPRPDILLLDEPFSNLDPSLRVQVRADVRAILKAAQTTAILVTHDQEEALSLADRMAMMLDGTIVQTGRPEDLYHRPATRAVASFIGDAQFLPGDTDGETVVTALGASPAATAGSGPVDALIRPEMIVLTPDTDESAGTPAGSGVGGVPGRIVSRQFYGHDQVITIELGRGETIETRVGGHYPVFPGSRVRLSVRGVVQTFPRG